MNSFDVLSEDMKRAVLRYAPELRHPLQLAPVNQTALALVPEWTAHVVLVESKKDSNPCDT